MAKVEQEYIGRDICLQNIKGVDCFVDSHYQINEVIGKGAYSVVFGGINKKTNQHVAIKKIKKEILEDEINTKRILREVNILRQVRHKSIIEMLDIIPPRCREEFDTCYIVFDRMATDLRRLIKSTTKLENHHIVYVGYQIFEALKYLHNCGVVHRDLTPANILVSQKCQIKICDFGLSRRVPDNVTDMTRHVVTRWYRAPEIMCWDEYTNPVDIWAAGCILAELYLRRPLFPGDHFIHQLNLIFEIIGTPKEEDCTNITVESLSFFIQRLETIPRKDMKTVFANTLANDHACDLFEKLFVFNPRKRIIIDDILSHRFFSEWYKPEEEQAKPDNFIVVDFEEMTDIEEIKDLLWKEIVLKTNENANQE